ncbi:MAG: SEC-C domain-containing protein [Betaproteobacteria bacterium]|nr:SEC-C domain-containing protein [Betaproteobacteria bacterium]
MRTSPDLDWYNAVEHLCHASAGHLLAGIAFPEFRNRVELLVGPLFDQLPLGQAARVPEIIRALATQAALEIWNATPIPANRFRPLKIAKPERNAPCPCASGRKYKQCCGAVPPPSLGIREETMLAQVIAHWPRKRLGELPLAELHPESLALVALDWQEEGSDMDAIALLEALFTHLPKLDGRAEHAADVLLDLYGDGSKSRKKLAFLEQLKAAPDKTLRSTAWQRQATLACDRGEVTAAWAAFGEAQRLTPNAPALSHLEVLLLLSEGRRTEARARADFWCARLARDGKFDHSSLIDTLRDMVSDDDEARLRNLALMDDPLGDVADISGDWTAPACHYTLAGARSCRPRLPWPASRRPGTKPSTPMTRSLTAGSICWKTSLSLPNPSWSCAIWSSGRWTSRPCPREAILSWRGNCSSGPRRFAARSSPASRPKTANFPGATSKTAPCSPWPPFGSRNLPTAIRRRPWNSCAGRSSSPTPTTTRDCAKS